MGRLIDTDSIEMITSNKISLNGITYIPLRDAISSVMNAPSVHDMDEISQKDKETEKMELLATIGNYEMDEDGYLHFTIQTDGYELEGLFRVYDDAEPDHSMELVSIDYGYLHSMIEQYWDSIEEELTKYVKENYPDRQNIQDKERLSKKKYLTSEETTFSKLTEQLKERTQEEITRDKHSVEIK